MAGAVGDGVAGMAGGLKDAAGAAIDGIHELHAAKVSGTARTCTKAKVSAVRAFMGLGDSTGLSTPTAVPAQCLSVADLAQKAGNFSVLLAAAEVSGWLGMWWLAC